MKPGKRYTPKEALARLMKYCAYQERCHREVEQKLFDLGIFDEEDRGNIILRLMDEGFLNEERFTRAFVRGRFRSKKWGKVKISYELKKKNISERLIEMAMSEIDEEEYRKVFEEVSAKRMKQIGGLQSADKRKKFITYMNARGFEFDLIYNFINLKNS